MTVQSIWRHACVGAKLGLGAAVVAGVMAFSAPAHAVVAGSFAFGGASPLDFDDNDPFAGGDTDISLGYSWTYQIVSNVDVPGDDWIAVKFVSDGSFNAVTLGDVDPNTSFEDATITWADNVDGTGDAVSGVIPADGSNFSLSTLFDGLGDVRYLIWSWSGITLGDEGLAALQGSITTSVIPLPAGFILFLSGLAGIGFLGRYKTKRREAAVV